MNERDEHGGLPEAELLELVLADLRSEGAARLRLEELRGGAPGEAQRAEDLAAFVRHLRVALAAPSATRARERSFDERALIQRVLERTTREDLSRWGDLRLAARFVAARLRSSGALRLAAASLLLHLMALPVVAWIVWTNPAAPARIWFSPAPAPAPFAEPSAEPLPGVSFPDPLEGSGMGSPGGLPAPASAYVANSVRWARFVIGADRPLLAAPPPAAAPGAGAQAEPERLLRLRLEVLAGHAQGLPEARPEPGAGALERALVAEVLLDALLVRGTAPPALEGALLALAPMGRRGGARSGAESEPAAAAQALLEACALARAEAYGVLPAASAPELDWARREFPAAARLLLRGEDARLVAPLDREWCALLLRVAGMRLPAGWDVALGAVR